MKKYFIITILIFSLFILCNCSSATKKENPSTYEPDSSSSLEKMHEIPEPFDPLTVNVQGGAIRGTVENGVHVFKGIPFAAPPVAELRFAPPQPIIPWEGILDCDTFQNMPVQTQHIEGLTYGEDCLYLNIWTPADAIDKKLPVFVFIHGGAFATGGANMDLYDGTRFARDGVIQINLAYRLNALGFLASKEMEEKYGYIGNAGILDQIAGLKWIQENIEQFGGDPHNITICGESAGAFSVSNLIMSPLAEGLFNKAIMESGNLLGQQMIAPLACGDLNQAMLTSKLFMESIGAETIADLQEIDAKILAEASAFSTDVTNPSVTNFWPVFDGKTLPKNPYKALLDGNYNKVDIIAGFNTDEGSIFVPGGIDEGTYKEYVKVVFGQKADKVLERFPVDENHTPTDRARYLILNGLRFGSDVFADEMINNGQKAYLYQFDYHVPSLVESGLGVMHGMELYFIFDTFPISDNPPPNITAFIDDVHNRWLNFVKTGNPNEGIKPKLSWPEYTKNSKEIIVLGNEIITSISPGQDDIEFFKNILWNN